MARRKTDYTNLDPSKLSQKEREATYKRLVATAFLPNPESYSDVNHTDEDRTNNNVDNLEWCSREYNNNYGNHNLNVARSLTKGKILVCNETEEEFLSPKEASERYGLDKRRVQNSANPKCGHKYAYTSDHSKRYSFYYKEEN